MAPKIPLNVLSGDCPMENQNEMLYAKDERWLNAVIKELEARHAALGIMEESGPPLFVQKLKRRFEERQARQRLCGRIQAGETICFSRFHLL